MNKIYVVTAIRIGIDDRAKVLAAFKNADDAKNYVQFDMEEMCDLLGDSNYSVDFDQMELSNYDDDYVKCWHVDEVEVQ